MKKILVIAFLGLFYFGSANSVTVDLSVKISGSTGADAWVYFSGSSGADEWVYISGSAGADKWVCISNPDQLDQEMLETLGLR